MKNKIKELNKQNIILKNKEIKELEKFKIFLVDNIKLLKSLKSDSVSMNKFNDLLYDNLKMHFYFSNSSYSEKLLFTYWLKRYKNEHYKEYNKNYVPKWLYKQGFWKIEVNINSTDQGDWIEKTFLKAINWYIKYKYEQIEQLKYTNKHITSIINKYKKIIKIKKELQNNKLFYYESKEYIKNNMHDYYYLKYLTK